MPRPACCTARWSRTRSSRASAAPASNASAATRSSATTSSRTGGCSCCRSSSGARSDRARQPSPRRDSRRSSVNPAKQTSPALPYRSSCLRHPRLLRRREPPRPRDRQDDAERPAGPQGPVLDVLRDQRNERSARRVLPVRVPAAAVSRLPASGSVARRVLRADERQRRSDLRHGGHAQAGLRGRSREDAHGRPGHGAVPRHRQRELPEQRRHRRHRAPAPRERRTS